MLQIQSLSGATAGGQWLTRRFPVLFGRNAECEIQIKEPGVFDDHAALDLDASCRVVIRVQEKALAAVNGEPVTETRLRNGDLLTLGSATLRVWLAPTKQAGLRTGEAMLWLFWSGVVVAQLGLLRWLWP